MSRPEHNMAWHADRVLARRYVLDELRPADAASVETHLMACGQCRALIAELSDTDRVAMSWVAITDEVDRTGAGLVERFLVRAGFRDHFARLWVLTPSLHAPWMVAVIAVLAGSVVMSQGRNGSDTTFFAFLVAAPLLPLLGVAAAFSRDTDPVHEITVATPIAALELLLVRAASVVATTTLLTFVASVAMPQRDWSAVAWLLPALGLTTISLALSRWMRAVWAASGLAAVWVIAATSTVVGRTGGVALPSQFYFFRTSGQVVIALATAAAVVVITTQRTTFDLRRTA